MNKYSQLTAMLAITRASLRAIFRSPSAVIFSFVFPFIFILVFGFIGNNGGRPSFKIVLARDCDTNNIVYQLFKTDESIRIISYPNDQELQKELQKGNITGILSIVKSKDSSTPYQISFRTTNASSDKWPQFVSIISEKKNLAGSIAFKDQRKEYADFEFKQERDETQVREYKTIDFILPGQLGFSLLSSGVFGVAFMFFNLRSTLVLKRFFATPISRTYIILGEGLSRVIFQMLTAIVIILAGRYFFGFTLVNGIETFVEMLILSFIGLVIFMGLGFIVSGVAKNESTIPPFANLITLPQFLLGGTFFSVEAFPHWLQIIAKMLPLTYLNIAMRSVAFEGMHFWNVTTDIRIFSLYWQMPVVFIFLAWGIIVYAVAVKLFKWE